METTICNNCGHNGPRPKHICNCHCHDFYAAGLKRAAEIARELQAKYALTDECSEEICAEVSRAILSEAEKG